MKENKEIPKSWRRNIINSLELIDDMEEFEKQLIAEAELLRKFREHEADWRRK